MLSNLLKKWSHQNITNKIEKYNIYTFIFAAAFFGFHGYIIGYYRGLLFWRNTKK